MPLQQFHEQVLIVYGSQNDDTSIPEYFCTESRTWKYYGGLKKSSHSSLTSVIWNNEAYFVQGEYNNGGNLFIGYFLLQIFKLNFTSKQFATINTRMCVTTPSVEFAVDEGVFRGIYITDYRSSVYR